MEDTWTFGLMSSSLYPAMLFHCVCHGLIMPLHLITPVSLLAGVLAVSSHWPTNSLLWVSSAHLLHLFLLSFFMDLLAIILAVSTHWVYHFIPWASLAHLLLLYLFLLLWVSCLIPWASSAHILYLYLFITRIGLLILILAMSTQLSLPLYSSGFLCSFTSSFPLVIPMGLPLYSLGFFSPFTSSLSLVTFMGLLAINPATSTH